MNISCTKRDWVIRAYLGLLLCGLGGIATRVDAQNAAAPVVSRAASIAASTTQGAEWVADEKLRRRVKAALHADPYFYDKHVTVSIEERSRRVTWVRLQRLGFATGAACRQEDCR